jgi:type II secretory pathway pseudopilin PulG
MKTPIPGSRPPHGHTLLEMIGAVSILIVLVSIILPKVIVLIEDAKLTADTMSIEGMQSATETYFQQYGKLAGPNGAPISTWTYNAFEDWDESVLLAGNFAEGAMRSRLATNAYVRLVKVSNTSTSADVLSAVGQVGRLPSFNCNNGYYNMMRQYALHRPPDDAGPMYADRRSTSRRAASGLAVSAGAARELPGLDRLLGAGGRTILPPVRLPRWKSAERVWNGLARICRGASRLLEGGPSPMRCCYPVPDTWPEPPPGIGGDDGTDDPRHDDPGADTEIVAPNSSNPVIVAEVVLQGITVQDAYRLSLAIDGRERSNWAFFDSLGRVKYDMYDSNGGTAVGIVFIYLAHK